MTYPEAATLKPGEWLDPTPAFDWSYADEITLTNGRVRIVCVTCTDTPAGFWARPLGVSVRLFFSRRDGWRYL
jgi:hypothetical protein